LSGSGAILSKLLNNLRRKFEMIKKKETKGLTQVFTILFKELKKQGIAIEKAKVIESKPLKPIKNVEGKRWSRNLFTG